MCCMFVLHTYNINNVLYVCTTYTLVGIWFRTVRHLLANGNVVCITIISSCWTIHPCKFRHCKECKVVLDLEVH